MNSTGRVGAPANLRDSHQKSVAQDMAATGSVRMSNTHDGTKEEVVNLEVMPDTAQVDAPQHLVQSDSRKDNNVTQDDYAEEENDEE